MKSVRLLPIVIFAAVALLLFKGLGLVTNGGYVLLGTTTVEAAAGGSSHPGTTSAEADAMGAPIEPTMTDTDPTAEDGAPTLPLGAEDEAGHGAAAETHAAPEDGAEHGEAAPESEITSAQTPAVDTHGAPVAADPMAGDPATASACPPVDAAITAEGEVEKDPVSVLPCDPALLTADGDTVPMVQDENGNLVPFAPEGGSEEEVLRRLGERRGELDAREQELDMRMALVEAAEKRINERSALLEQLEARINALVDQTKSAEEAQFKAIVDMYETMKPKEAAAILDELDMHTLLRVARAISPRKMAPIMAKMDPVKARDLTASMAIAPTEPYRGRHF
jgi:flagellar motility protein MotE (MotC chaperone)